LLLTPRFAKAGGTPALQHAQFVAQFVDQFLRNLERRAFDVLCLLRFLRNVQAFDFLQILADADCTSASVTLRSGLFFACLMPISVA
jgi:hypothetical protein